MPTRYAARIEWQPYFLGDRFTIRVEDCDTLEEAFTRAWDAAHRSGWTRPKWWQWWRWSEARP